MHLNGFEDLEKLVASKSVSSFIDLVDGIVKETRSENQHSLPEIHARELNSEKATSSLHLFFTKVETVW